MADKIGFTKDELHKIYDQVTSPPSSGTHGEVNTSSALGSQTEISAASALGSQHEPATGLDLTPGHPTRADTSSGMRSEVLSAPDRMQPTKTSPGADIGPVPGATHAEQRNQAATGSSLRPQDEANRSSGLGAGRETATNKNTAGHTSVVVGTSIEHGKNTTDPQIASRRKAASASDPANVDKATKGSRTAHRTNILAEIGIGKHKQNVKEVEPVPPTETAVSLDLKQSNKATTDAKTAHQSNIIAATSLGTHDDVRRDSDVGPRNETAPEHHHHRHHDKDKTEHEKHDHQEDKPEHHHDEYRAKEFKAAEKGIVYGNVSHLGVSATQDPTDGSRRKSLAESPYRGRIDSTVSPPSPSKKWSFTMGDFGLKVPKQESNAVTQELNKDGSVSMQGGQGRVPRGIGSISSTVRRGSVDKTVTERDPAKRWSFVHGDFGLKMPKQESNAVAQELNRDGSVSAQGGLGPIPIGVVGEGGRRVSLGRQGARGIGSISSSVRKGSVDATVSEHDKARKWSLKDADFGLKWPRQPSNLHE
ncbi:hypothetical protein EPUS_03148 [Endocarpon pusillum Z07020]|uniref:Uncharacterized protein n=1 Tax=Endocarpon pusillum (strain Z07020 / HMAS-L-300199) TaxID=1263415 RepID=U1HS13_ENDPU|nr:uncharacterized protein EPUS_03148 [Endocarpon pusillum Z07020]ERF73315.1 hypothetical protein EPUS_03148 [Endocarpon pusillum Z07020]